VLCLGRPIRTASQDDGSWPPEDCGGIWGYTEFLAATGDPGHPEHDSMLEWIGGAFDPAEFDASDFTHRLQLGRFAE
jgi:hypothetical protein